MQTGRSYYTREEDPRDKAIAEAIRKNYVPYRVAKAKANREKCGCPEDSATTKGKQTNAPRGSHGSPIHVDAGVIEYKAYGTGERVTVDAPTVNADAWEGYRPYSGYGSDSDQPEWYNPEEGDPNFPEPGQTTRPYGGQSEWYATVDGVKQYFGPVVRVPVGNAPDGVKANEDGLRPFNFE